MKIAHVVATFPPDIGGMGQVSYDESMELARRGHEVTVFTISYLPHQYQDSHIPFKIVRLKPLIKSGIAGQLPGLSRKLKGFDLVHLHYPFYGGAEWVWFSGQPYIITHHMDAAPTKTFQMNIKHIYDAIFSKRIIQKAKRVILVDENYQTAEKKFLLPNQSIVLVNGINTNLFKPQSVDLAKLGLSEFKSKKIVLFVGNLIQVKGLSNLLKAWKNIDNDSAGLVIIGGGFNESEYRSEADRLGLKNIIWLGICKDANKLAKYYNTARVLVVSSESESFSLTAVEAMASGIPVIANNLPTLADKIIDGETGYLYSSKNTGDLESKLSMILEKDDSEIKKIGENGRRLVKNKFSIQSHVDSLLEIYKEVI